MKLIQKFKKFLKKSYFKCLVSLFFNKKRYRYAPSPIGQKIIPYLPRFNADWNCGYQVSPLMNNYLWLKCSIRGEHEPALEQVLSLALSKDSSVIDAGAQIGLLSTLCAKIVGNAGCVYSFEPHPNNYATLVEAISLNEMSNVKLINKGLNDRGGRLYFWEALPSGFSLLPENKNEWPLEARQVHDIECTTIDDFISEENVKNVDVLKVDVDGADFPILLGAQNLLKQKDPPLVIFESSCYWLPLGHRLKSALSFFWQLDYALYVSPISSKRIFYLSEQDTLPSGWGEEIRKALNIYAIKNDRLKIRLSSLFDRAEPISNLDY